MELAVQSYPSRRIGLSVHFVDDAGEVGQLDLRASPSGPAGGGHLDIRSSLDEILGGELAVVRHGCMGRDDDGARAGLGFRQPQGLAGPQRFSNHRPAYPVSFSQRRFGWELRADRKVAVLDSGVQIVEHRFRRVAPHNRARTICPAIRQAHTQYSAPAEWRMSTMAGRLRGLRLLARG